MPVVVNACNTRFTILNFYMHKDTLLMIWILYNRPTELYLTDIVYALIRNIWQPPFTFWFHRFSYFRYQERVTSTDFVLWGGLTYHNGILVHSCCHILHNFIVLFKSFSISLNGLYNTTPILGTSSVEIPQSMLYNFN